MIRRLCLGVLFGVVSLKASAMIVYDPVNWVENAAAAASMAKQIEQSVLQTKYQFEQLKRMKENLQTFHWKEVQGAINQLASDMERGKALAFSMQNLDGEFKKRFPGFEKSPAGRVDYHQKYGEWVNTNQDTMNNTMRSMGNQYHVLKDEKDLRNTLLSQAKTADGSLKAVQIGNEIAAEQVNQMQHLRQIMITQTSSMAEYQAFEAQKDAQKEKVMEEVMGKLDANASTKYDSRGGFGEFKEVPY